MPKNQVEMTQAQTFATYFVSGCALEHDVVWMPCGARPTRPDTKLIARFQV